MQIPANSYLTWQRAQTTIDVSSPRRVGDDLPSWWRSLPGNLSAITTSCPHQEILHDHGMRSAKFCLGLRGAKTLGWTIPLDRPIDASVVDSQSDPWEIFYRNVKDPSWPECKTEQDFEHLPDHIKKECVEVHGYRTSTQRSAAFWSGSDVLVSSFLHPEMVHGSTWTQTDDQGSYLWNLILISWPWRARLDQHWRLMMMANQFDWDPNYHVFTGCVDGNHVPTRQTWSFDQPKDPGFNYVNLEVVIAVRSGYIIPESRCIFTALPVYDPDYQPAAQHRRMPDFRQMKSSKP